MSVTHGGSPAAYPHYERDGVAKKARIRPTKSTFIFWGEIKNEDENEVKKAECICFFRKDVGSLTLTNKNVRFRSALHDKKIPYSEIQNIKKQGNNKILVKLANEEFKIGPFQDTRRGTIHAILRENWISCGGGGDNNKPQNKFENLDIKETENIDEETENIFSTPMEPLSETQMQMQMFSDPKESDIEKIMVDEEFPCPLKQLCSKIWKKSFSEELHLQREGDTDLQIEPWTLHDSKSFFSRVLHWKKKSGPMTCTVHQTQRARLRSPSEMMVETTNVVEGVPMADYFTVESRWKLTEEQNNTRLKISIRIDWKKSSFLKSKIEKATLSGSVDYFNNYASLIRSLLQQPVKGSKIKANPAPATNSVQTKGFEDTSILNWKWIALAAIFVLFVGYVWLASWQTYAYELRTRSLILEQNGLILEKKVSELLKKNLDLEKTNAELSEFKFHNLSCSRLNDFVLQTMKTVKQDLAGSNTDHKTQSGENDSQVPGGIEKQPNECAKNIFERQQQFTWSAAILRKLLLVEKLLQDLSIPQLDSTS